MSIPITVVGGYLGSGKTTLINQALRMAQPRQLERLAILVNDFGSVNIDAALIRSQSPDSQILGLAGGCVCCAVRDDLASALETVKSLGVRHVVLEASGVASPAKICSYGRDWPGFSNRGSLVVVDASTVRARMADKYVGALIRQQLAEANALVFHSHAAAVALPDLLRGRPVWHANDPAALDGLLDEQQHWQAHSIAQAGQLPEFVSVTLRREQPLAAVALRQWLAGLPAAITRVKGYVATTTGPVLVQQVAAQTRIEPCEQAAPTVLTAIAPSAAISLPDLVAAVGSQWQVD